MLCDMRSNSDQLSADYDDKKSRFTEYSMTSSVIRRNAQLSLLDDRFEQVIPVFRSNVVLPNFASFANAIFISVILVDGSIR